MKRTIIPVLLIVAASLQPSFNASAAPSASAPPDSLTLERALSLVRENNPRVRQATEEMNAADANVTKSRSGYFPQITATSSYNYRDPVSEASFGGTAFKFMPNNNYDSRVTAHMMLVDFGRTSRGVDLALSGKKSAEHRLELTSRDLSWSTIQLFYSMLFLREAVKVQDKEISALHKSLDFTTKRYKQGAATRFDALSTEVRLASASNKKIDLENELKNREISLRRLTGIQGNEPLNLKGSFAITPADAEAATISARALEQRVELRLAREQEKAAEYRKSIAGKEGLPKIVGSVSYGITNGYLPDMDKNQGNVAAGVELQIPLFTGFRTSASKREAVAMLHAAEQERIDTEQQVSAEIRQSVNTLRTSAEKIGTTKLQVDQARLAAEHARARYENGLATTLDLLSTEASLAEAELSHLQALYDYVLNSYALKRAAGDQFRQ